MSINTIRYKKIYSIQFVEERCTMEIKNKLIVNNIIE
jgi:hypothetical protein